MRNALILAMTVSMLACAHAPVDTIGNAVTMGIRTDDRGSLALYPTEGSPGVLKAYLEAEKGARYRIVLHNNLNCRVGLVIAVDGRNIISGAKSWLGNEERMYILGPNETQEYAGWRTAQDKENRFYFTNMEDSYAAAFNDTTAMGVVAMAVYPECVPSRPNEPQISGFPYRGGAGNMPSQDLARKAQSNETKALSQPGSGYGEAIYSPSITVDFQPEPNPREKTLIKYEWRETLLRMGVIHGRPIPGNRLWESGFAPPPPRL